MRTSMSTVLAGLVIAATTTGCFTTWAASRALGAPPWEERVREEVVPLPGVTEQLTVTLPVDPPTQSASTAATAGAATAPFALQCALHQQGTDSVFHSGIVHGRNWKIATGIATLFEAASGAALLLTADDAKDPGKRTEAKLYGGFLSLDAIGSAVLFLLPRREVVRTDQRVTRTPVRGDCPDGLTLDIGGDSFVVDAAGRIGEVGDAALRAWMQQPVGPVLVSLDGRALELRIGPAEQCAWQRAHDRANPSACAAGAARPQDVAAVFDVPVGTLSAPPPVTSE